MSRGAKEINTLAVPEENVNGIGLDNPQNRGMYLLPSEVVGRPDITGYMISSSNDQGKFVWSENPVLSLKLGDLADVDTTGAVTGNVIVYDAGTQIWYATDDSTASGLYSDNGANIIDVSASANPVVGQVLVATGPNAATWQNVGAAFTAGLGIDAIQLLSNIIQVDVTDRFTFTGNQLELNIVPVSFGGTGNVFLSPNGVLLGNGILPVTTSKQAPLGDFVGDSDIQTLTNKTITDSTNDVICSGLFSNAKANVVDVSASANPSVGQALIATSSTTATWQDNVSSLTAGLGIDAVQLASDIIQLETTARFTYSGNALELSTVSVDFGGTGQTTLTANGVLVGDNTNPVDTSKQAPSGDFVGTTDTQTLTNKTITDNTNDITANAIFSNGGANTVDVSAAANPVAGQTLTATSSTTATWQDVTSEAFYAYDSVGNVVLGSGGTQGTLVYNIVVLNENNLNYVYNSGTGEMTINDSGVYEIIFSVTVATDGTATPNDRSSMSCFLQEDTGGGFSGSVAGSFSWTYIREELVDVVISTAESSIIYEVTVPVGLRVRYFQNLNTAMKTRQNASRWSIKKLN